MQETNEVPFACTRSAISAVVCLGCILLSANSMAGWRAVTLNPPGAVKSEAYGADASQQAGLVVSGGIAQAALWNLTASSYVSLHPVGATSSQVLSAHGNQQVGLVTFSSSDRAALWTGTSSSFVNLHPTGSVVSRAHGVWGGQQVGFYESGGIAHACTWTGTAASLTDLHPSGTHGSFLLGTSGSNQVGYIDVISGPGYEYHAGLWAGSGGSFVQLHPPGALQSIAYAVSGNQQVGVSVFLTGYKASIWYGNSASFVDITPAAAEGAWLYGVSGGFQAGYATFAGVWHAGVWNGSAASFEDLHSYLSGFTNSEAHGIYTSGQRVKVVGYGMRTNTGNNEAILWVRTFAAPLVSAAVLQGSYLGGSLAALNQSDNSYFVTICDEFDSTGEVFIVAQTTISNSESISGKVESRASRPDLTQFVRLRNFATNQFDVTDSRTATLVDQSLGFIQSAANHTNASGEIMVSLLWLPQNDVDAADGWSMSIDLVQIETD